ncbi:MAG: heme exporter protein CcmD [Pseudomonadota bacterium]
MPELGPYAVSVLASYAVSLTLLASLVALSWWRFRRMRAALDALERQAVRRD